MKRKVVFSPGVFALWKISRRASASRGWHDDIRNQLHALNKNMYDKAKAQFHSKFVLRAPYIHLSFCCFSFNQE